MKKLFIIAILSCNFLNAQSNVFPTTGNVGIGTTNPGAKLHTVLTDNNAAAPIATFQRVGSGSLGSLGFYSGLNTSFYNTIVRPGDKALVFDNDGDHLVSANSGLVISPWSSAASGIKIMENGNVGIGTANPGASLHAVLTNDNAAAPIAAFQRIGSGSTGSLGFYSGLNTGFYNTIVRPGDKALVFDNDGDHLASANSGLVIAPWSSVASGIKIMENGNVGIGAVNPAYKLDVIGAIRAREVRVNLSGADFVFEDSYKLMPLNELEKFIRQNKHLPEIAPAKEMQEKGGDLGSLSVQLLQKIEELTLHAIEQNKEINFLKEKIRKLEQK